MNGKKNQMQKITSPISKLLQIRKIFFENFDRSGFYSNFTFFTGNRLLTGEKLEPDHA